MDLNTERQGDILIAKADGRVDGANAREFQAALDAAINDSERAVILDMEHLSYISSAGLRVILLTAKTLQTQNAKFAVCSLSGPIQEVFEISGFDKIIAIHASQAELHSKTDQFRAFTDIGNPFIIDEAGDLSNQIKKR
ncbi:MAG: STAS domain-containing protein [Dehalococcoidia bacterium]|nr:STAS domain-containing protein [Dehalococcoidia bacterium]